MNLTEAKNILNKHGYLCEFLTKFFKPEVVMNRINKELDLDIINYIEYHNNPGGKFKFKYENNFEAIKNKINHIMEIYKYHCSIEKVDDTIAKVEFYNISADNPKTVYNPVNNFRIFIHGSEAGPEIIMQTGIRSKSATSGYDKRIYLEALDLEEYSTYRQIAQDFSDPDILSDGYSIYHYLIKLPENYKIYTDPEGYDGCSWVYTKQNIPPQYILYLGQGGTLYDRETGDETKIETKSAVSYNDIFKFITK